MKNWLIFTKERFPPFKHLPLIVFFFLANGGDSFLSFFVILSVFFRLRVFDEIKDYETDLQIHPERPLARGLISTSEAKTVAFALIGVELGLSWIIGWPALIAASLVIFYSLLMYKEFFLGSWLRPKMATYALTHTLIASFMGFFISNSPFFALSNWMIFNVFEFGRKTFGEGEEKPQIESYSKKFGSWGAVLIVLGFALVALIANPLSIILVIPLAVIGSFYGHTNSDAWACRFRLACSLYILLYYMIKTVEILL
jgi:4-hydroxybenzoate polyprenyltransferase